MRDAVARLRDWKLSAARVGAEVALITALSFHPQLDLDLLVGQREGFILQPEDEAKIRERAHHLAHYAECDQFVPPTQPPPEDDDSEATDSAEQYLSDSNLDFP
jgi:hypothetical protein